MTSKKAYYINFGLLWWFAPLIVGYSLSLHPILGIIVWFGISAGFIIKGLKEPREDKDTGETQNIDKKNPPT